MKVIQLLTAWCLLFMGNTAKAIDNDSIRLAQKGVPILSVRTVDEEMPTCDFVWAPEGYNGISIINNNKVPGRVILTEGDSTLYDSGEYEKKTSGMTIRIRGNTSVYYYSKKPYKIKLEKKNDLLNRGDSCYYDREWILIHDGDYRLHTMLGLKLNELLGLGGWTPSYKFVNLIFNGTYEGVYMLVESVKRNKDCRINVDKASGYLIERDSYWWNEDIYFKTPLNKEYTFKYPDSDDLLSEQLYYIRSFILRMEKAIEAGSYDDIIDTRSFATWLLAHDILGTSDSGGANIYLTKYDSSDTTKLYMSTMWDFDSCFKNDSKWARIHESSFFYFPLLFSSDNKSFSNLYCQLWEELSDSIFTQMENYLQEYLTSDECSMLDASRVFDAQRWNYYRVPVKTNINDALKWFRERKTWLDTQIRQIETKATAVQYQERRSHPTYNLQGIQLKQAGLHHGIYIVNGRKRIIK